MAESGNIKSQSPQSPSQKARAEYIRPEMRSRENKANTDAGLNSAQKAAADKTENAIRNRKTEVAYAIDSNGNVIKVSGKGTRSKATVNVSMIPQDSVLTHNHPGEEDRPIYNRSGKKIGVGGGGQGMGARIGSSITGDDIRVAIKSNAKEIRAVTPYYTFSIRRPKDGWGVNGDDFLKEWYREVQNYRARNVGYARSGREQLGRFNAVMAHQATRKLAKKYGMTYTRRKA